MLRVLNILTASHQLQGKHKFGWIFATLGASTSKAHNSKVQELSPLQLQRQLFLSTQHTSARYMWKQEEPFCHIPTLLVHPLLVHTKQTQMWNKLIFCLVCSALPALLALIFLQKLRHRPHGRPLGLTRGLTGGFDERLEILSDVPYGQTSNSSW